MTVNGRRIVTLLILPLMLVLSSCVKVEYAARISSTERIELSASIGFQKSAAGQGISAKELCSLLPKIKGSVQPSEFDDGVYVGCKLSGNFKLSEIDGQGITYDKATDIWTFRVEGADISGQQISVGMISTFSVEVTFPGKVLEASGKGQVDGTTVTWSDPADLLLSEGIQAKANSTGGPINWKLIVLGALGIILVGGAAYSLLSRRNRGERAAARQANQNAPLAGIGPMPGPANVFNQSSGYTAGPLSEGFSPQQPNLMGYPGQPTPGAGYQMGGPEQNLPGRMGYQTGNPTGPRFQPNPGASPFGRPPVGDRSTESVGGFDPRRPVNPGGPEQKEAQLDWKADKPGSGQIPPEIYRD